MKKRAAIEISVTAIIVLIIAVVVIGLILGFLKNMLGEAAKPLEEKMGEEPDPITATSSNPISLSRSNIITNSGESEIIKISVYNPTEYDWYADTYSDAMAYWPLDGNANDLVGNNDGTEYHRTGYGISYDEGHIGQAASFDGESYINFGNDPSLDFTKKVTFSAWIIPFSTSGYLIAKNTRFEYAVVYRDNELSTHINNTYLGPSHTFPTDKFSHFVSVYDGTILKHFINGEKQAVELPISSDTESSGLMLFMGGVCANPPTCTVGGRFFTGSIDEAAIWNRALSEDEIKDLYDLPGVAPEIECDDIEVTGEVNKKVVNKGASPVYVYVIDIINANPGTYLCTVSIMDNKKEFTIKIK